MAPLLQVGYFGAELACFMNMHDNAKLHVYTILKMEKLLPVNCNVSNVKLGCFSASSKLVDYQCDRSTPNYPHKASKITKQQRIRSMFL